MHPEGSRGRDRRINEIGGKIALYENVSNPTNYG
jgi:hypothetical protein